MVINWKRRCGRLKKNRFMPIYEAMLRICKARPGFVEGARQIIDAGQVAGKVREIVKVKHDMARLTAASYIRCALLALAFVGYSLTADQSPTARPIVLLRPAIRFENLEGGVWVNFGIPEGPAPRSKPVPNNPDAYENFLLDTAKFNIGARGEIHEATSLDPSLHEAREALELLASRLSRGSVNDDAIQALAKFAAVNDRYAVMAQFIRVQTGPGRAWNPNTGAIASSSATTLFQCALLEAKTGKVVWKGENLVRYKALQPIDSAFGKALKDLYKDFAIP